MQIIQIPPPNRQVRFGFLLETLVMDVFKNCVFIDEAGFNLHTQRNHGRSLKDTPTKSTVPTGKGVTFTILGTISQSRYHKYWS